MNKTGLFIAMVLGALLGRYIAHTDLFLVMYFPGFLTVVYGIWVNMPYDEDSQKKKKMVKSK